MRQAHAVHTQTKAGAQLAGFFASAYRPLARSPSAAVLTVLHSPEDGCAVYQPSLRLRAGMRTADMRMFEECDVAGNAPLLDDSILLCL
jgi:hypothetical protein